jgi:hypothetical protein
VRRQESFLNRVNLASEGFDLALILYKSRMAASTTRLGIVRAFPPQERCQ